MRSEDARAYLGVQRAAVRGLAIEYYSQTVIEAWAPLPITDEDVDGVLANPENEFRLIAEVGDEIVGIGSVIPNQMELRACYVVPMMAKGCRFGPCARDRAHRSRTQSGASRNGRFGKC
jgi:hypothetical protein